MRHPALVLRVMKGGAIHPKLKMFGSHKRKFDPEHPKGPIEGLHSGIHKLTISHGLGVKPMEKKIRKPLKFIM